MKNGLFELKTDTWAIIGAGAAMAAIMMTVMLALNAATNARISEQSARIQALDARVDMIHDTMRDEHTDMRNEHTLILESLAGIAQRVSYIEGRLGIGRAADSDSSGSP